MHDDKCYRQIGEQFMRLFIGFARFILTAFAFMFLTFIFARKGK